MTSTVRAMICFGMIVGFYLVGLIEFLLVAGLIAWVGTLTHPLVAKSLMWVGFAAFGSMAVAAWRAMRARPEPPKGLPVGRDDAPLLWVTVEELARAVGTRIPDEIRLVPGVNAAVTEDSRLLGLIGGRRCLYIGLPLLQAMRVDQLRSVIAHELGHYGRWHTRLGAVAYRGRLAIGGTVSRVGSVNPIGWGFKAYGNLYLLVDNALVRRQEREADRAAVRVAGRTAAASALHDLPVLKAAWDFFFESYVVSGWKSGYAPDDLFGGFKQLVEARKEELDALRGKSSPSVRSKWDTHPPVAERVAAIMTYPEIAEAADPRPAGVLISDLIAVGQVMQRTMGDVGDRTVLPWPEFTHAALTARMQREADRTFRVIARVTGGEGEGLRGVFDAIAAGRLADIAEPLFPNATRRELGPLFTGPLQRLLRLAAIHSGVARWRHSWAEPAELVRADGDGTPLPIEEIAELAVSPGGLAEAMRRLADLGIKIEALSQVETSAGAIGARVIAGLANCKVDDAEHDVYVLTKGLVFVAEPGQADKGRQRMREMIASVPAVELATTYRFVPYEEIASAKITKHTPVHAEFVLHNGRRLSVHEQWRSETVAKKCPEVFAEVVEQLG